MSNRLLNLIFRFNGSVNGFTKRPRTKRQHRRTRLATYNKKPVAIGGFDPDGDSHNEVELLSNFDSSWASIEEYPFSMRFRKHPTVKTLYSGLF